MADMPCNNQEIHSPTQLDPQRITLRRARSPLHILVVDDDDVTRQMMQSLLGPNYCITSCGGVSQAVQEYLRVMPDLVFMDIDLGDQEFNGFDIAYTIRMHDADASIVFLSAHESPQNIAHATRCGAVGFMSKPIFPSRILHYVQQCEHAKFGSAY